MEERSTRRTSWTRMEGGYETREVSSAVGAMVDSAAEVERCDPHGAIIDKREDNTPVIIGAPFLSLMHGRLSSNVVTQRHVDLCEV